MQVSLSPKGKVRYAHLGGNSNELRVSKNTFKNNIFAFCSYMILF